jgi:YD repeat-containing protein
LSKVQYKKNGSNYVMVDSVDNKYNFNDYNTDKLYYRQRNLRIQQLAFGNWGTPLEESSFYPEVTPGVDWEFSYTAYDYISAWVQQESSEHITYDQNGANPLTNLTKYYYDNPTHMLATRIETTDSKGMKVTSHTSYPQDYASGNTFIDDMVAQNITGAPIENVSYQVDASQNVEVLKGTVSVYKTGGKGIIDRVKVLETNAPIALSGFRFSNTSQGLLPSATSTRNVLTPDSRYADRILINSVNTYGNANEQQKMNDVKEVYFWGYKGLYPVAKLVGTDYNTAQSYITQSILDNAQGGNDDSTLRTELNKLRNVPGAMVTTFTYKPLVGITSQTDPSGKIVFYEYDTFGRLKLIKDQNGKILKQYDYQYKASITQ